MSVSELDKGRAVLWFCAGRMVAMNDLARTWFPVEVATVRALVLILS